MKPAGVVFGGLVVVVLLIVMAVQPRATGQPTPAPTTPAPAPAPSTTGVPLPMDVPLGSVAAYSTLVLSAIALCLTAFIVARDAGPRRGGSWN